MSQYVKIGIQYNFSDERVVGIVINFEFARLHFRACEYVLSRIVAGCLRVERGHVNEESNGHEDKYEQQCHEEFGERARFVSLKQFAVLPEQDDHLSKEAS